MELQNLWNWFNVLVAHPLNKFNFIVTKKEFLKFLELKQKNIHTESQFDKLRQRYINDPFIARANFQCAGITQKGLRCQNSVHCPHRHDNYLVEEIIFFRQDVIDRVLEDVHDTLADADVFIFNNDLDKLNEARLDENIKVIKFQFA